MDQSLCLWMSISRAHTDGRVRFGKKGVHRPPPPPHKMVFSYLPECEKSECEQQKKLKPINSHLLNQVESKKVAKRGRVKRKRGKV